MVRSTVFIAALLSLMQLASPKLASQSRASEGGRQTQEDDDTRYELLAPDTAQFRIYYEVTGTTAGARFFFNTIRPGSIATDERVIDLEIQRSSAPDKYAETEETAFAKATTVSPKQCGGGRGQSPYSQKRRSHAQFPHRFRNFVEWGRGPAAGRAVARTLCN